jgi:hypothetical protein
VPEPEKREAPSKPAPAKKKLSYLESRVQSLYARWAELEAKQQ